MREPLKIIYAAIDGGLDYRREARTEQPTRLDHFLTTVDAVKATRKEPDLLVFPAGYFQFLTENDLHSFAADVAGRLANVRASFGVVWGMDVDDEKQRSKTGQQFDQEHPFFVSYRGAAGEFVTLQQVSLTVEEGKSAHIDAKWRNRSPLLPGTQIALLICGECLSQNLLERVEEAGSRALVVAAHQSVKMHTDPSGWGKLSWHIPLDAFSRSSGIPTVLSEHTRSPDRHPHAWPAEISEPLAVQGVPSAVTLRLATVP